MAARPADAPPARPSASAEARPAASQPPAASGHPRSAARPSASADPDPSRPPPPPAASPPTALSAPLLAGFLAALLHGALQQLLCGGGVCGLDSRFYLDVVESGRLDSISFIGQPVFLLFLALGPLLGPAGSIRVVSALLAGLSALVFARLLGRLGLGPRAALALALATSLSYSGFTLAGGLYKNELGLLIGLLLVESLHARWPQKPADLAQPALLGLLLAWSHASSVLHFAATLSAASALLAWRARRVGLALALGALFLAVWAGAPLLLGTAPLSAWAGYLGVVLETALALAVLMAPLWAVAWLAASRDRPRPPHDPSASPPPPSAPPILLSTLAGLLLLWVGPHLPPLAPLIGFLLSPPLEYARLPFLSLFLSALPAVLIGWRAARERSPALSDLLLGALIASLALGAFSPLAHLWRWRFYIDSLWFVGIGFALALAPAALSTARPPSAPPSAGRLPTPSRGAMRAGRGPSPPSALGRLIPPGLSCLSSDALARASIGLWAALNLVFLGASLAPALHLRLGV